jgi:hypothetical protein
MKRKHEYSEIAPVKHLRGCGSVSRYFAGTGESLKEVSSALSSIMVAAQTGQVDIVKYHIQNTPKDYYHQVFGPQRKNLLHLAAASESEELITYLIQNKITNLFAKDDNSCIPLQLAKNKCKIIIQREMNWIKVHGILFYYKFNKKNKIPVNIIRYLCVNFLI